jgi:MFS family permease
MCCDNTDRHSRKFFKITGMVCLGIAAAIIFAFIFGYIVQHLWNWLMPPIFGLTTITFWQAFAIVILCKILFGGFGKYHSRKPYFERGPHHPWKRFDKFGMNWCHPSHDWKHFKKFWNEEGKESFENYIKRMERNGDKENAE